MTNIAVTHYPASQAAVNFLTDPKVCEEPEYQWYFLPNGDVILGFFPKGDDLELVRSTMADDFYRAQADDALGVVEGEAV